MDKKRATIIKVKGLTTSQHSIRLSEQMKEMDANPQTCPTPLGVWTSGKGGTSATTFGSPGPITIRSKKKYRS